MSAVKQQEIRARLAAYRGLKTEDHSSKLPQDCTKSECDSSISPHQDAVDHSKRPSPWWMTGLKILLWVLLWGFFIEVEFGMVYLVASGLVLIVLSLRGGKKRAPDELSAYSVFNKNFETIEGTLSAEQFEKELRYGPTSVH